MPEDSHAYYKRRAAEELAAIEHATSPAAADVHKLLAARYSLLAEQAASSATEDPSVRQP